MIRQKGLGFSVFGLCIIAIWIMSYSLFMTERTMETVRNALEIFVHSILPPLAVFSVCAKLLVKTDLMTRLVPDSISAFFGMLGMSVSGFSAFLFGLFAGFPTGAAMLADLCEKGEISEKEAASLLPFCNQASVAFLFGTVGSSMLRDPSAGFIFFLAQTVTAWICVCLTADERRGEMNFAVRRKSQSISFVSAFTSSVRESAVSMIGVCGFVVFFSLMGRVIFDTLYACGCSYNRLFVVMIGGGLEISSGFLELAQGAFSEQEIFIFGGVLLGLGGFSVFMQAMERTEQIFFSPEKYFKGKLLAGVICPMISVLFWFLNERNDGKKLIIVFLILIFCIFYLLNYVKIKFFSKKCGKIKRNAV